MKLYHDLGARCKVMALTPYHKNGGDVFDYMDIYAVFESGERKLLDTSIYSPFGLEYEAANVRKQLGKIEEPVLGLVIQHRKRKKNEPVGNAYEEYFPLEKLDKNLIKARISERIIRTDDLDELFEIGYNFGIKLY